MSKYLNLGCGARINGSWVNLDFNSANPEVIKHDLRAPLPFSDHSFRAVYHSHVLEHLKASEGEYLLRECVRILEPGGILRIAVPDLESIIRAYITALDDVRAGKKDAISHHEWLLLELYDQTTREESGGEIVTYLHKPNLACEDFIISRWGFEAKKIIRSRTIALPDRSDPHLLSFYQSRLNLTGRIRERFLRFLLGNDYEQLNICRFRNSGEIHKCMYDEIRLRRLLTKVGLESIVRREPSTSYLENWSSFNLDTEIDGSVYKPDSLYIEALRPETK